MSSMSSYAATLSSNPSCGHHPTVAMDDNGAGFYDTIKLPLTAGGPVDPTARSHLPDPPAAALARLEERADLARKELRSVPDLLTPQPCSAPFLCADWVFGRDRVFGRDMEVTPHN